MKLLSLEHFRLLGRILLIYAMLAAVVAMANQGAARFVYGGF